MSRQVFVGLMTEGSTDNRFLESVVKRTFDEIGFECKGEVEIFVKYIPIDKSGSEFIEQVLNASKKGTEEYGIMILCVHADADKSDDKDAFQDKIIPAQQALQQKNEKEYCKIITAIVPVQMIEAWMLADKELLKKEIGTEKTDEELGLTRKPETIAAPKKVIEEAIRIARAELTKRKRRNLTISELYLPLGQKTSIEKLNQLPSFLKFKDAVREAYQKLNLMQ